jgi:hypothetical protein
MPSHRGLFVSQLAIAALAGTFTASASVSMFIKFWEASLIGDKKDNGIS